MSGEPTLAQRKIIYQARRGLKELDYYIDPYVKLNYLTAPSDEQRAFERLVEYEDPDLLLFFLGQERPDDDEVSALIERMKQLKHAQS
ncbi:succinate dehydrogenase assembly factor 2 [Moraxella sp. Tifton1]|uniref:FAD assembly factor SdhE n=1 Tax=Moraxella oculi TaxID=2940516 RepID=A0ABW8U6J3_9GAMM|nr:succinate dehydrogenase assembly factor 2 [Moraxella sp. Tifton1]MCL1623552.1 succinate dehydrogenase assembly factor 2 [Moraxella sp. Tifton1]